MDLERVPGGSVPLLRRFMEGLARGSAKVFCDLEKGTAVLGPSFGLGDAVGVTHARDISCFPVLTGQLPSDVLTVLTCNHTIQGQYSRAFHYTWNRLTSSPWL